MSTVPSQMLDGVGTPFAAIAEDSPSPSQAPLQPPDIDSVPNFGRRVMPANTYVAIITNVLLIVVLIAASIVGYYVQHGDFKL